jgi:hypothetical protein
MRQHDKPLITELGGGLAPDGSEIGAELPVASITDLPRDFRYPRSLAIRLLSDLVGGLKYPRHLAVIAWRDPNRRLEVVGE